MLAEGTTVTTPGFTGKVQRQYVRDRAPEMLVYFKDYTGVPVVAETVTGPGKLVGSQVASGTIGTVLTAPVHSLPTIKDVTTGDGEAPGLASTVTCGGTLNIDVTGLAAGAYDLIVADTVTGTFSAVNITGGTGSVTYTSTKMTLAVV